ncbi:undecaprenyl-diphosphatase [Kushneria phosphatilytica]|uniref:Undecaprenyl-diphosphatase n=2 Tax=Kushneria phosphatilytica TaxID=657387 RepID=A0A1S1NSI6_9GAMM|nr:undecaprenyl-diphosphatase [Kushneria phosphatilytica]QEL12693.1 undecaprenyl-diphosphate phosphatase [Kushneria phosphatilytica]
MLTDWHPWQALILGIVEGITEFLPVSSTGHLILVAHWIGFDGRVSKPFEVVIQLGSILAVIWAYLDRVIFAVRGVVQRDPVALRFARNVLLGFLPSAVVGFVFIDQITRVLFDPRIVAGMLIIGGVVIIMIERFVRAPVISATDDIGWRQALAVGVAQCFAVIPGTSRSGATIVGGMLSGLSRRTATEFSFFLAIPTMLGATTLDLWKYHTGLTFGDVLTIAVGFMAAFVSALIVVRVLVRFVERHTLAVFGWYRILFGGLLMVLLFTGHG